MADQQLQARDIKLSLSTSNNDRYRKALSILSSILPEHLTEKDINIICLIYQMEGKRELTTAKRKSIREVLGISEQDLNNYVRQLKRKKVLVEDKEKVVRLNDTLDIQIASGQPFIIRFVVAIES